MAVVVDVAAVAEDVVVDVVDKYYTTKFKSSEKGILKNYGVNNNYWSYIIDRSSF